MQAASRHIVPSVIENEVWHRLSRENAHQSAAELSWIYTTQKNCTPIEDAIPAMEVVASSIEDQKVDT